MSVHTTDVAAVPLRYYLVLPFDFALPFDSQMIADLAADSAVHPQSLEDFAVLPQTMRDLDDHFHGLRYSVAGLSALHFDSRDLQLRPFEFESS